MNQRGGSRFFGALVAVTLHLLVPLLAPANARWVDYQRHR